MLLFFSYLFFFTFSALMKHEHDAVESFFGMKTVNTTCGPVQRKTHANHDTFLGIPYATPPIDHLRWKPTVSIEKSSSCPWKEPRWF